MVAGQDQFFIVNYMIELENLFVVAFCLKYNTIKLDYKQSFSCNLLYFSNKAKQTINRSKQAGAELCQAQLKLR